MDQTRIAQLQAQSEQAQIKQREDGTYIYRLGPDKWADAQTLQRLLAKLVQTMESHQEKVSVASSQEIEGLLVDWNELQVRMMNYQTGLYLLSQIGKESDV